MSMNKRIAELRGDEKCIYMQDWPDGGCMGDCNGCANPHSKHYDTDIACAMELWEEMKATGFMVLKGRGNSLKCVWMIENAEMISCHGNTEAEAIAGAWLKWKEGA